MAALADAIPYGLRKVAICGFTDAAQTTPETTLTRLPYAQTMSFTEAEDFEELRGDDRTVTHRGKGGHVEWDLEAGGLSFNAVKKMYGGTVTTTGTSPAQKTVFRKLVTDQRPWFKADGQSISDSGGDVHAILYKSRSTDNFTGEFADGSFWITGASGMSIASNEAVALDALYDFVQNETAITTVTG